MLPVRDYLPTRIVPFVNYALIATNIAVFLAEIASAPPGSDTDPIVERWALVPAALAAHPLHYAPTLLTHMFLHANWMHVGGNMLFLWIFGDNVEDALGHARYLLFYLLCGFVAAFAEVSMSLHTRVPMLGASGAIAGVLAAYGLLYPRSPIAIVNPIPLLWLFWGLFLRVPAWLVIAGFFLVNLWNAFQPSNGEGGVAFMAHVGGFIAGLIMLPLLRSRPPVEHETWSRWLGPRRGSAV